MPDYQLYQGAWTGPEIDAAIGRSARISNPNLLDNWYLPNPINQRGQSSYSTTNAYMVDRWKHSANAGNVSFDSSGMLIASGTDVHQFIEKTRFLSGAKYTLSVLFSNGLKTATGTITVGSGMSNWQIYTGMSAGNIAIRQSNADAFQLVIWGDGTNKVVAAKLELGDTQTLAHQENGVWVLNEIPNYAEELAKCQRYFVRYPLIVLTGMSSSTGKAVGTPLVTPQPMRAITSVSGTPLWVRWPTSGNLITGITTDFTNAAVNNNVVEGIFASHNSIPTITFCAVQWSNLTISCEL